MNVKTLPGADCGSDHKLLVAKVRVKLRKREKVKVEAKFDTNAIPYEYTIAVENRFAMLNASDMDVNEEWAKSKEIITTKAVKHVPKQKRAKKAHRLTENTVKIAEKRRKAKAVKSENYKRLCAEFQKAARTDKNNYIQGVCEDIERNSAKKHAGAMIKKIKEITWSFTHKLGSLKSRDGIILNEDEEVMCRWKEYTAELYLRDQNIT